MVKYILKRLVLGLISACIVTIIVMVMIYSLLDRNLIFASDPAYNKTYNNNKIVYKQEKFEEYGYVDYVNYSEYISYLKSEGKITEEERAAAAVFGTEDVDTSTGVYTATDDSDITKECINSFVDCYQPQGYTIVRLNRVMIKKGRVAPGGDVKLYATRDRPLINRVGEFFGNMFHLDNIHYADTVTGDRGYTFTWYDPAYGGSQFSPAILGNGTQYRYVLYCDSCFPFIHSNLLEIRLGKSYSINKGVDVWETMTTKQGYNVQQLNYYPSGVQEVTSDDLHTTQYVEGSYNPDNPIIYRRFVDDYTSTSSYKAGRSQMGYSFVIGLISTLIAYVLGFPLGILMAKHKGKIADKLGTIYIVFIIAVPSLAYIFMFKFIGGCMGLPTTFFTDSAHAEQYGALVYILPIVSLALPSIAGLMQWTRRYMIDQTNSDYVKFARAGGLSEGEIFTKHIFKNAIIPIVHGIPAAILGSLVGAIITERVYTVPGVGNVLTKAINAYDNSVIVGVTFFYTIISVVAVLLGDILMSIMDPRISFSTKGR